MTAKVELSGKHFGMRNTCCMELNIQNIIRILPYEMTDKNVGKSRKHWEAQ